MKKLRVLALLHDYLVPPDDVQGVDVVNAAWKTEYDVTNTLATMGHDVYTLGLADELGVIKEAMKEAKLVGIGSFRRFVALFPQLFKIEGEVPRQSVSLVRR